MSAVRIVDSGTRGLVMVSDRCGHAARGFSGEPLCCDLPAGHAGLHAQSVKLRHGTETTNWGSDGLAPWATRDR